VVKAELMTEIADIEMEGHLIDSQMLTRVLDKIMDMGGEFEIKTFRIGEKKNDTSYVQITVTGEDSAHLDRILRELNALGARLLEIWSSPGDSTPPPIIPPMCAIMGPGWRLCQPPWTASLSCMTEKQCARPSAI
jgi:hypothetical protein